MATWNVRWLHFAPTQALNVFTKTKVISPQNGNDVSKVTANRWMPPTRRVLATQGMIPYSISKCLSLHERVCAALKPRSCSVEFWSSWRYTQTKGVFRIRDGANIRKSESNLRGDASWLLLKVGVNGLFGVLYIFVYRDSAANFLSRVKAYEGGC